MNVSEKRKNRNIIHMNRKLSLSLSDKCLVIIKNIF